MNPLKDGAFCEKLSEVDVLETVNHNGETFRPDSDI